VSRAKIKIEDKPIYSIGFERLAPEDSPEDEDIPELLSAMASFAAGWLKPTLIEINVRHGASSIVEVTGTDEIPEAVLRATAGGSPGIYVTWRISHATLPPEVEPIESTVGAFTVAGSTDHGRMEIKVSTYWSAWLQFPSMLNAAIERLLGRSGWTQAQWSLQQENHWQVQEWLEGS